MKNWVIWNYIFVFLEIQRTWWKEYKANECGHDEEAT